MGRGGDRLGAEEAFGRILQGRVWNFRAGFLGIAYIEFKYRSSTPNMSQEIICSWVRIRSKWFGMLY